MKNDIIIKKKTPKIHLEIGELVLHGFDYNTKYNVASEIEKELTMLIRENGLPKYGGNDVNQKHNLATNKHNDLSPTNTSSVGYQVAYSIYRNLPKNMMMVNHKTIKGNDQTVTQFEKIDQKE